MDKYDPFEDDVFNDAVDEDTISRDTLDTLRVSNFTTAINNAMGNAATDFEHSEGVLLNLLVDDSSSIRSGGNTDNVIMGFDTIIAAMKAVQQNQRDNMEVQVWFINSGLVLPFTPLSDVPSLRDLNYMPNGMTPLYDVSLSFYAAIVKKTKELEDCGVTVRSITLTLTDGDDTSSQRSTAIDCSKWVRDMLRTEMHIVCGMGVKVDDVDYRAIFQDMGLEDRWILTPGNSEKEIREAFQLFSETASQAAVSGTGFSQTSLGGFQ